MKFHIKVLKLWLNNGKTRKVTFEPNKVNIVTGNSSTGKTAILDIIDYCFFASKSEIPDAIINKNTAWYGLSFSINEKNYVMARKAPVQSKVSEDYYFSSSGDLPKEAPIANNTKSAVKKVIEAEFGIDENVKIPFGGENISAGSKISLRYFLLFNTISQNIIINKYIFFDIKNKNYYKEALPRIFDLAVGIDDIENVLRKEKKKEIKKKIKEIERIMKQKNNGANIFHSNISKTIQQAKEYLLISEDTDIEDSIEQLQSMVNSVTLSIKDKPLPKYDSITRDIQLLQLQIRNLDLFSQEYTLHKKNLKEVNDSLKPISFINENDNLIIKTPAYKDIITSLTAEFKKIKAAVKEMTPLDSNISNFKKKYEEKINKLNLERELLPEKENVFENDAAKHIFIGEIKAKLELYAPEQNNTEESDNLKILSLENDLKNLKINDIEQNKKEFLESINKIMQGYMEHIGTALGNYKECHLSFNYQDKKLEIKKDILAPVEETGSSSNYMFLHLFLFLGLQKIIMQRGIPFVPPFLVIDQFSRPYWGNGQEKKKDHLNNDDMSKVKAALRLLNQFITDAKKDFQMIVFEHIDQSMWKDMKNIHLVEEFTNGNALIPESLLERG